MNSYVAVSSFWRSLTVQQGVVMVVNWKESHCCNRTTPRLRPLSLAPLFTRVYAVRLPHRHDTLRSEFQVPGVVATSETYKFYVSETTFMPVVVECLF